MPELNPKDYIVNVGPQGTFNRSGNYQTLPGDIDQLFLNFQANNVRKIALYFHGGLVSETSGLASAERVAGYRQQSGAAPICFVWETGLVETISTNLSKISENP